MSTYTGVTNCQKQSGFLAHPVHCSSNLYLWLISRDSQHVAAANVAESSETILARYGSVCCFAIVKVLLKKVTTATAAAAQ